jgi:hypothetical protein
MPAALPRVNGPMTVAPPMPAAPPRPPSEFWTPQPTATVTTSAKRSTPLGRIVLLVVVALVAGLVAFGVFSRGNAVPSATSAFADGHGIPFTAPDGTFSVQMPTAPQVDQKPLSIGAYTAKMTFADSSGDGYEIGVASFVLPISPPVSQVDAMLDDALNSGISTVKGTAVNKVSVKRGGLPALEATFKAPDGYPVHALVMSWGKKLYVLFVHAKAGTERLYHALDTSFTVH